MARSPLGIRLGKVPVHLLASVVAAARLCGPPGAAAADCDDELPAPSQFAAFAAAAIDAATASPHCTAARRYVAVPSYQRFLLLLQLRRQGSPPPKQSVARGAAAFAAAHAGQQSAAEAGLAAYYASELRLPDAAGAAHAAIDQLITEAFAACP